MYSAVTVLSFNIFPPTQTDLSGAEPPRLRAATLGGVLPQPADCPLEPHGLGLPGLRLPDSRGGLPRPLPRRLHGST